MFSYPILAMYFFGAAFLCFPHRFWHKKWDYKFTKGSVFMDFESVINFILAQIPFLITMTVLIYFLWIRPKRKRQRIEKDPDYQTQMGDEILFADGLVGLITKYKDGIVTVESGSGRTKYQIKDDMFLENLSKKERIRKAFKSKNLWQKILSVI